MSNAPLGPATILLTGAHGQVGSELLRSLAPHGRVVATVRQNPPHAATISADNVAWRAADMTRLEHLRDLVHEVRPTLIVNAAAYTAVEAAELDRAGAVLVNTTAPGVLAAAAREIGAAMIHYSTDYVFDGSGDRPWREDDVPHPLNVYGETKLAGEEAIRDVGIAHLILRTAWVYGVMGRNFVKTMLRLARERSEIQVVDDQFGAPTSARVLADVTATIIELAAGNPALLFERQGGTIHVTCAGATTWCGFAQEIFRQARERGLLARSPVIRPIASADYPSRVRRPANSRMDNSRLRERFSLSPPDWKAELSANLPALVEQFERESATQS